MGNSWWNAFSSGHGCTALPLQWIPADTSKRIDTGRRSFQRRGRRLWISLHLRLLNGAQPAEAEWVLLPSRSANHATVLGGSLFRARGDHDCRRVGDNRRRAGHYNSALFGIVGNALLLQGWTCSPAICNGPLWTVGVEVFYYAIAPLFISARPWVFALMICVSAIAGIYLNGDIWNMRWGCTGSRWHGHGLAVSTGTGTVRDDHGCARSRELLLRPIRTFRSGVRYGRFQRGSDDRRAAHSCVQVSPPPLLYLGELSYPLYVLHWPTIVGLIACAGYRIR